ncbi:MULTISPECIES: HdeD family acid-resistance protein [Nitratiruptor]|uniref:Uncharacterized membrane protein HdeD, DUF308 family n=1 Tax=Nitratiruptor tergarcus DSM 16512 TaxID=1069081 RepID=A0A1W1WRQ6_9BACT|nr:MULTISPECIES: DUF308 domain-containing protein [Nitratiruptor]BCD61180.1 hypothetical protein NitYY0813_C0013 [Nitratiruptor sp. YY08-13]BCD65113.1 hypothetical protein NitYY0826_C0013 [Nitratiruptor sp. YY08-26]SMC08690.1 Uncharacterized membrane protein HdeD, DUF308 family [Nitratiruptor tergarcus DSM 16512]
MVGYNNLLQDKELLKKFEKHSKIAGVIFLLLGLVGIFYPVIMSLTAAYFVAFLFIFSGLTFGYHTWQTDKKDWLGWLKAFIYLLTGILVTIFPVPGVAALGIILAIYFFMDGFASFALSSQMKGQKYNWLIILNGILSIILGVIFLVYWPFGSLVLVGLFVGISMFFDGIVLLSMSSVVKKLEDEDSSNDSNA